MSFKLSLLPNQSKKEINSEIPHYDKPYYSGSSKVMGWFLNHITYFISFLFPVVFLLILMAQHGFAPFGDKNLFSIGDAQVALPAVLNLFSAIQSGDVSLLFSNSATGLEAINSIIYFMSSPSRLLLLLFSAETAIILLHILVVLQIGFSGFAMAYYLTHKEHGHRYSKYDPSIILFSLCYSLSSYMLIQYNDFMYLECAVLFPLVFLAFEKLIFAGKWKPFYFLYTYMFFTNFYLATILFFFLFLYYILQKKQDFRTECCTVFRYIFVSALCFLSSGITTIPGFYWFYHTYIKTSTCPDFSFITDWLSLYSDFMPATGASFTQTHFYGSNLYCGLFVLILLFFYLIDKNAAWAQKLRNLLFLSLLLFISNTSTFQYLFHLVGADDSVFNAFGFLIPFFLIAFCCDSMLDLKQHPALRQILILLIPILLYFACTLYASNYSNTSSMMITLILLVVYFMLFLFYAIKSINGKAFYICIFLTLMTELCVNGTEVLSFLSTSTFSVSDSIQAYAESVSKPSTDPLQIPEVDFSLPLCYHIEGDYKQPGDYSATAFERFNDFAYALGSSKPLFTEAKLELTWKEAENIDVKKTPDNIFTVRVTEDTPNAEVPQNHLVLSVTPDMDGTLYLYTTSAELIGAVKAGEQKSHYFYFPTITNTYSNYWLYGAYYHADVLDNLREALACNYSSFEKTGLASYTSVIEPKTDGTFVINIPHSAFLKVYLDGKLQESFAGPDDQTAFAVTAGAHNLRIQYDYTPFYIGLFLTLFVCCTLLVLCRYARTQTGFAVSVSRLRERILYSSFFAKTESYYEQNKIAMLSFIIPFSILMIACVVSSYEPFGADSFYKNDGALLTLPTMYLMRDHLSRNSFFYTWITGGGSNLFYTLPSMFLYYWLCLFQTDSLGGVATIIECIFMALSGYSMYLYLTRRALGSRMHRQDYRLLIFTTAYSLSAYALHFRGFFSWPIILVLFPLILLSLDKLMLQKRTSAYIFWLALCIMLNYQLGMYICFFLVFTFFMYHFNGFKDFLAKGIRFAFASIVAAGINFFALYSTILALKVNPYQNTDSVFPSFTFYQSYWESLKQTFLFSEPVIITIKNGAINLYCSIICILLFFISLFVTKNKKLYIGKLCVLLFILFSSNNNTLSYIWNGFHYQSKVPNRYSFLLIFLLLEMSCEALLHLKNLTLRKTVLVFGISVLYIGSISFFAWDTISLPSFIGTVVVCCLLFFCLLLWHRKCLRKVVLMRLIVALTLLELTVNTCHTFISAPEYIANDYYAQSINYLKDQFPEATTGKRLALLGPKLTNQNMIYQLNIMAQFNSFLTQHQQVHGYMNGSYTGNNIFESYNNLSPFSNTMDGVEYMILDLFTNTKYVDTEHYKPVGQYNTAVVLHNEYALPMAHYAPMELCTYTSNQDFSASTYANAYAKAFIGDNDIFKHIDVLYNIDTNKDVDPINYYVDTVADFNEADEQNHVHTLHYTPKESGEYYYRLDEYYYLGYLEKGTAYEFEIPVQDDYKGTIAMLDRDAYEAFAKEINKHTLNITSQTDTTLDGTITLPKDGCIVFSIPYEDGWTVYVDGKEAETSHLSDSSLFITASAGTHEIHMEFKPVGFEVCVGVSLVFVGIFLLIVCIDLHQKRRTLIVSK